MPLCDRLQKSIGGGVSRTIEPGSRFKQAWVCEGHKQLSRTEAEPSPQGETGCMPRERGADS